MRTVPRRWPSLSLLAVPSLAAALAVVTASPVLAQYAYVVSPGSGIVTAIDTTTHTVAGVIATPSPARVEVTADGTRAYIGSSAAVGTITVIDTSGHGVVGAINVGPGLGAFAISADATRLYASVDATLRVLDAQTGDELATVVLPGAIGGIELANDGSRAYVTAAGDLHTIFTEDNTVTAAGLASNASGPLVVAPSGDRVYLTTGGDLFGSGTSVVAIDPTNHVVVGQVGVGSILGELAIAPDGSRVYVGQQAHWVDTGYGAGFFTDRWVAVLDTSGGGLARAATIDLGASGPGWSQQNAPSGIAVTADRGHVYVGIPRLSSVAVVPFNTNIVSQLIPGIPSPRQVTAQPDANAVYVPLVVTANDDAAPYPIANGGNVVAVANVLANDRIGGIRATVTSVVLTQLAATTGGIALDGNGAVTVTASTEIGSEQLTYRICERAEPANCDDATVSVTVRAPYALDGVDDTATSKPGRTVLNVLTNDILNGLPATTAAVSLSVVSSSHGGLQLNVSNGSLYLLAQTPAGQYELVYRMCEKQDPGNCDTATVRVAVIGLVVDAVDDAGATTRSGGTAVANVLANDTLDGIAASLLRLTLTQVATTNSAVTVNAATGAVHVANGAPKGTHAVTYRICETIVPTNCDQATATVTVAAYPIDAVNDYGKGASKRANTVIANVLANDRLAGVMASTGSVIVSQVSLTPYSNRIQLDVATGAVRVTGKTNSGLYSLVYRICERADTTNCDVATATIDLSGGL